MAPPGRKGHCHFIRGEKEEKLTCYDELFETFLLSPRRAVGGTNKCLYEGQKLGGFKAPIHNKPLTG